MICRGAFTVTTCIGNFMPINQFSSIRTKTVNSPPPCSTEAYACLIGTGFGSGYNINGMQQSKKSKNQKWDDNFLGNTAASKKFETA
jgi:hypothetical protein